MNATGAPVLDENQLRDHLVESTHRGVIFGRVDQSTLRDLGSMMFREHEKNGVVVFNGVLNAEFWEVAAYLMNSPEGELLASVANRHQSDFSEFMNVLRILGVLDEMNNALVRKSYNDHVNDVVASVGDGAAYHMVATFALIRIFDDYKGSPSCKQSVDYANMQFGGVFS